MGARSKGKTKQVAVTAAKKGKIAVYKRSDEKKLFCLIEKFSLQLKWFVQKGHFFPPVTVLRKFFFKKYFWPQIVSILYVVYYMCSMTYP